MLDTPFGIIRILSNGNDIPYKHEKLNKLCIGNSRLPVFEVEGRYRITINISIPSTSLSLECRFGPSETIDCCKINSGERLALITWERDNLMFSIGTEDEVDGTEIEYLSSGLRVNITDSSYIDNAVFGIAWTYIKDYEKEQNYTWFAADPTYVI